MDNKPSNPSLKVILVGSSGVGKTSIISSYFDNTFENQELPTVAPASCTASIQLDGRTVDLQIWDTAGQERFQSISQMFYRDSHVAFVCYDKERTDSVVQWVDKVRSAVPTCAIFLVTTKTDLLSTDEQTECAENGSELVKSLNLRLHLLTSASSGLGIKELFMHAAQVINEITPPTVEKTVKISDQPARNGNNNKKQCC